MASKKTHSVKKFAPKAKVAVKVKAAPKAKAAPVKQGPRHPRGRVIEKHGELAKSIAAAIARADQDAGSLETQLKKASNAQLLRLQRATQTLKDKFGNRDKLIAAIGAASNKAKDKDYLAKLDSYSLPQLLDLAAGAQRGART
jgi:hypothetical protein